MQGQYKTPKGEIVKVEIFDAENKMVYVQIPNGQHKWYIESEYSAWESTEPKDIYGAASYKELLEIFDTKPVQSISVDLPIGNVLEIGKEGKPKKQTPKKNAKTNPK